MSAPCRVAAVCGAQHRGDVGAGGPLVSTWPSMTGTQEETPPPEDTTMPEDLPVAKQLSIALFPTNTAGVLYFSNRSLAFLSITQQGQAHITGASTQRAVLKRAPSHPCAHEREDNTRVRALRINGGTLEQVL